MTKDKYSTCSGALETPPFVACCAAIDDDAELSPFYSFCEVSDVSSTPVLGHESDEAPY